MSWDCAESRTRFAALTMIDLFLWIKNFLRHHFRPIKRPFFWIIVEKQSFFLQSSDSFRTFGIVEVVCN